MALPPPEGVDVAPEQAARKSAVEAARIVRMISS
jgi:hypothetical protein